MERLEKILSLSDPVDTMADIGTDHGFVPYTFLKEKKANFAIATDISAPSLEKAKALCSSWGSEKIQCRLGDGLAPLKPGECQAIVIAGMGGNLIYTILQKGMEIAKFCKYLILQPMQAVDFLRENLEDLGFYIEKEDIAYERGKYYHIFKVIYNPDLCKENQDPYRAFLKDKSPIKKAWIDYEIKRLENLSSFIKKAQDPSRQEEKLEEVEKKLLKLREWLDEFC